MRVHLSRAVLVVLIALVVGCGRKPAPEEAAPPPKIDGVLDDALWENARELSVARLSYGTPAEGKTRVLVAHDAENLYLAAECFEKPELMKKAVADVKQHDGNVWTDDCIEFFIDPANARFAYYQIIVNTIGVVSDVYHAEPGEPDKRWNPKLEVKTKVNAEGWTVELSIPLEAFNRTPASKSTWAFNVSRTRTAAHELSFLSAPMTGSSHTPKRFGTLKDMPEMTLNPEAHSPKMPPPPVEKVVFDFETDAELAHWSNLKETNAKARGFGEPPVKIELAAGGATSGKRALKLTYAGGTFPTVVCERVPDAASWREHRTFMVDVTVPRTCIVVFRVLTGGVSRWGPPSGKPGVRFVKVARCEAGRNTVVEVLPLRRQTQAVRTFEIYMLKPRKDESITIDNVRISTGKPGHTTPYREKNVLSVGDAIGNYPWYPQPTAFTVLGEKRKAKSERQIGEEAAKTWRKPVFRRIDEVERDFRHEFNALKEKHPRAVLAIFREGEKGFDPANPDRVYTGWRDAYFTAHDPGSVFEGVIARTWGRSPATEMFIRRRCTLFRVDLSSIPAGSEILAAKMILVKTQTPKEPEGKPSQWSCFKPNSWVAEICSKPWVETEVNGFEYAKDRFWNEACGMNWEGEDPDFLPIFVRLGQSGLNLCEWEFTEAVKYWTDGKHQNHGCAIHCDLGHMDIFRAHTREATVVKNRPALMVVYEPKP